MLVFVRGPRASYVRASRITRSVLDADVEEKRLQPDRESRERKKLSAKEIELLKRSSSLSQLNVACFATWSRVVQTALLIMPATM